LLTAIGLTPGGSSTVHIYIQAIHKNPINSGRLGAVPLFCELYPGICLTSFIVCTSFIFSLDLK